VLTGSRQMVARGLSSLLPDPGTHTGLVRVGFESSALKHENSSYRTGLFRTWHRHKALHMIRETVRRLDGDRDGRLFARCVLPDSRPCTAWMPAVVGLHASRRQSSACTWTPTAACVSRAWPQLSTDGCTV
jgi:hypothetical protein